MTNELIISIISLIITSIIGVLTVVANIRISKINNTESIKKYNRHITGFELQFKDEEWLANLIKNDEFQYYTPKSQQHIIEWWNKYLENHVPIILKSYLPENYDYTKLGSPGPGWLGSTGKDDDNDIDW